MAVDDTFYVMYMLTTHFRYYIDRSKYNDISV